MADFDSLCEKAAAANGCEYIFGDRQQVELYLPTFEVSKTKGLIMLAPFQEVHTWSGGLIESTTVTLNIGLGRLGILDESYQTKSREALEEMRLLMLEFLKSLAYCATPYIGLASEIGIEINRFSENLDCVFAKITLKDG
jgi:hypothetical protein